MLIVNSVFTQSLAINNTERLYRRIALRREYGMFTLRPYGMQFDCFNRSIVNLREYDYDDLLEVNRATWNTERSSGTDGVYQLLILCKQSLIVGNT